MYEQSDAAECLRLPADHTLLTQRQPLRPSGLSLAALKALGCIPPQDAALPVSALAPIQVRRTEEACTLCQPWGLGLGISCIHPHDD